MPDPARDCAQRDEDVRRAMRIKAWQATSAAMQCDCGTRCTLLQTTECLYRKTLDMLSRADITAEQDVSMILPPLAQCVARLKSREGHALAAQYAVALRDGDTDEMLDTCHRLIDLARRIEEEQPPRHH